MRDGESLALPRHVRALFGAGAAGSASDGQLLERFRGRGGDPDAEAAFAVLVARHGPMVLGVCRRALPNAEDADDAFQATFLVLVRKAGSVRVDDSLGRWLYGVSRRVAARARTDAARQAARERSELPPEPPVEDDPPERRELLRALDEEVARLPASFREAILLCDLGGLTHETAAEQLGCPVGTLESRLFRARKRLREQLARRGLAPGVTATMGLGLPPLAVPEPLIQSTVNAAARAAPVSKAVAVLLEGVLHDMFWTKLKHLTLSLGAAAAACGLGALAVGRLMAEDRPARRPPPALVQAPSDPQGVPVPLQPTRRVQPGDTLLIEVLEALPGRPISGERLVRPDGTISLGFYGDLQVAGLTRDEIKVKVVEHMKKYLSNDVLGLWRIDDNGTEENVQDDRTVPVAPVDSDRVFVDESPTYRSRTRAKEAAPPTPAESAGVLKPGDRLLIETLEALPGRPISGERLVRPDGTLSLGFYGDLQVAGLTLNETKVKVIDHLRRYLSDQQLGLIQANPKSGKLVAVAPAESTHVFVDQIVGAREEPARLQDTLDRILEAVEARSASPRQPPRADPRVANHERRLGRIEEKLDRLLQALEKR